MSAIIPPRVQRGDLIGVIAPAGPVRPDRLAKGLGRLGDVFRVKVAPSVTGPRPDGVPSYLAASDDVRLAELEAMLADRDIRAIILARGGYGISRLLARLDPALIRDDPKPIVGFSDGTALLAWALAAGVRGIHGPVLAQLGDLGDDDVQHVISLLTDVRPRGVRPWQLRTHGSGIHRGALLPANLTMASMLVGTPWQLPFAGAIALFEDVGEKPYELDRYLTHLTIAGGLSTLSAAIIGDLVRCADPKPPTGVPDPADAGVATMIERLTSAGLGLAIGAPVGHGEINEAIPFGATCSLDLDRGTFEILDAAVA